MSGGKDGEPEEPCGKVTPPENDTPFDLWLKIGLRRLFDDVANEPIPEELLNLIEEDRDDRMP